MAAEETTVDFIRRQIADVRDNYSYARLHGYIEASYHAKVINQDECSTLSDELNAVYDYKYNQRGV